IDPKDYEKVRSDLAAEIEAIENPSGRPIGTRAFRPEDLYREVRNVAPDLTCYFGNLDWRSIGSVGLKSVHTFENDTGPDDANHDWNGIFILRSAANGIPKGERQGLKIYDVAPTILGLCGIEPPSGMIGKGVC